MVADCVNMNQIRYQSRHS